jgi:hypothetical protein
VRRALGIAGTAIGTQSLLDLSIKCRQLLDDGTGAARLRFVAQLQRTHGLDGVACHVAGDDLTQHYHGADRRET